MKLASWNINSIKVRQDHVERFVKDQAPDILMLQELKSEDFPADAFGALGYESETAAQKTYNGVAVLSKDPMTVLHRALPGNDNDPQARYLEADINGLRVINIYLPNGNPAGSEKFAYKLEWMELLKTRLQELRDERIPFVIGGDFNLIPEDKDCYDPQAWADDALFRLESRRQFRAMMHMGLTDAFRVFHPESGLYTYWDYKAGAWHKNMGIRIDHFLTSPEITDRLEHCFVDTAPRGWEKPSDHTPILLEIAA